MCSWRCRGDKKPNWSIDSGVAGFDVDVLEHFDTTEHLGGRVWHGVASDGLGDIDRVSEEHTGYDADSTKNKCTAPSTQTWSWSNHLSVGCWKVGSEGKA